MGTWGTAVKSNDAFADIYSEFFELYDKGGHPEVISKKIIDDNHEILAIEEEKNSLWFALALAQWETKSLEPKILSKVEDIISSGDELRIWHELDAREQDIKKRKVALDKFLEQLKSDRPKAKSRRKIKLKTPIFSTGDCISFKLKNGNYGGAIVLATDYRPETGYNLVVTTRINQETKPNLEDFGNAEALVCNFGAWTDKPEVTWYWPDLYFKDYSDLYEVIGTINIEFQYDVNNSLGKGYLFHPSFTSGWSMKYMMDMQLESELIKPKSEKKITISQLIKKAKWWKI